MPYANTGGGSKRPLSPAEASGKQRKDAAQMKGKSIPWMIKQAKNKDVKKSFDSGWGEKTA
tara:strand:- start:125 stop:307 length:183 start_codon:yes stop_codon:yes gene_type:complete